MTEPILATFNAYTPDQMRLYAHAQDLTLAVLRFKDSLHTMVEAATDEPTTKVLDGVRDALNLACEFYDVIPETLVE